MKPVSIHEAKTNLSRLIARAEAGEEIVLRRRQTPVAKLIAYEHSTERREPGALRGEIELAEDFDQLPPEFEPFTTD